MLLLAHRGLPGEAGSENTVAAVRAALDAGADGVEVDVRLTADDVLVACHDPDLRRLTGSPTPVATSSWSELRAQAAQAGVELATVADLLAATAGARVVLEVKQPPPAPSATARTALLLAAQLRALQREGRELDVTVSSFAPAVAQHVRRLLRPGSGVRTALLGRPLVRPSGLVRQALAGGHDEVHPHVTALLAAPDAVAAAHAVGVAVVPWTANRRREIRRCARLGVDAVITDVPVSARVALLSSGTTAV